MKRTTLSLNMDQPNRAQMAVERRFPSRVTLTQQFKLKGFDYVGCCIMTNGNMAFVEHWKSKVQITRSDGSLQSSIDSIKE